MLRIAVRLIADAVLVALCLFVSAGTLAWWRAWVLLAVLLVARGIGARAVYRVNPALLRERAKLRLHPDQPNTDRVLLLAVLATGFLGLPAIAGLDVFRWHVLPPPPPSGQCWRPCGVCARMVAEESGASGLEERFLRRELPGYTEYTTRVRHRLIPRVW